MCWDLQFAHMPIHRDLQAAYVISYAAIIGRLITCCHFRQTLVAVAMNFHSYHALPHYVHTQFHSCGLDNIGTWSRPNLLAPWHTSTPGILASSNLLILQDFVGTKLQLDFDFVVLSLTKYQDLWPRIHWHHRNLCALITSLVGFVISQVHSWVFTTDHTYLGICASSNTIGNLSLPWLHNCSAVCCQSPCVLWYSLLSCA